MEALEVLEATRTNLREHGWTPGGEGWSGGHSGDGPLCLEGALLRALEITIKWEPGEPNAHELLIMLTHPAYKALCVAAGLNTYSRHTHRLAGWNDDHDELAVYQVIEDAIAAERAKLKPMEVVIPPAQFEHVNGEKPVSMVQIISGAPDYVPESWLKSAKEKILTFL